MSSPEQTTQQAVEAVYTFAAEQLHNGVSETEVEQRLRGQGLDAESARMVVEEMSEAISSAWQSAGRKNMLYGALWCIGGLAVTVISFQVASGRGTYVVAWGAIIFGAIQFVRGMMQSAGNWIPAVYWLSPNTQLFIRRSHTMTVLVWTWLSGILIAASNREQLIKEKTDSVQFFANLTYVLAALAVVFLILAIVLGIYLDRRKKAQKRALQAKRELSAKVDPETSTR